MDTNILFTWTGTRIKDSRQDKAQLGLEWLNDDAHPKITKGTVFAILGLPWIIQSNAIM
jgi:hypothetical protein